MLHVTAKYDNSNKNRQRIMKVLFSGREEEGNSLGFRWWSLLGRTECSVIIRTFGATCSGTLALDFFCALVQVRFLSRAWANWSVEVFDEALNNNNGEMRAPINK